MEINKIKEDLECYKNKTLTLEKLYDVIFENDKKKIKEYKDFKYNEIAKIVKDLIDDGILSPIGLNKKGELKKGYSDKTFYNLPVKFEIVKTVNQKPMIKEYTTEINWFHSKLKGNKKIFNDIDLYVQYRNQIKKVDEYLKKYKTNEIISVNERSYELFNDEKFLSNQDKKVNKDEKKINFLQMLGLTEEDLHCQKHYEPLLVFASSTFYSKDVRKILIVENLDTFWSFQKIIFRDKIIADIDMIIYGAGNKITGGLSTYKQYDITENDSILYFGDIDSAGLNFYIQIKDKYPLKIELFREAYEKLIDCTMTREKLNNRGKEQILLSDEKLERILNEFPNSKHKEVITNLIKEQKYIPQEALNYAILKERWTVDNE